MSFKLFFRALGADVMALTLDGWNLIDLAVFTRTDLAEVEETRLRCLVPIVQKLLRDKPKGFETFFFVPYSEDQTFVSAKKSFLKEFFWFTNAKTFQVSFPLSFLSIFCLFKKK